MGLIRVAPCLFEPENQPLLGMLFRWMVRECGAAIEWKGEDYNGIVYYLVQGAGIPTGAIPFSLSAEEIVPGVLIISVNT